jgi:hypothetical protein
VNAMRRWLWATIAGGVVAGLVFAFLHAGELLDRFAPFDLDRTPNLFTGIHLLLFARDPGRCFAALDRGHVGYEGAPDRPLEDGCGYDHAAFLMRSNVSYGSGRLLLRCPALVSLLLWERHVVEPAATRELGRHVTAIRHLGTYTCRNINHATFGRRSQHALAKAIDIASFRTDDGALISVAKDWSDAGPRGKFLHAVRDGACRFFGVVLSPDYNALHRDHLHLDTSLWSVCR